MKPLSPAQAAVARVLLALLPVCIVAIWAWTIFAIDVGVPGRLDRSGHIKGHDFLHFYVLGQIGLERDSSKLYDFEAQSTMADRLVPEYEHYFFPVHPPQVAMFMAPIAKLSYVEALSVWLLTSAVLYIMCCVLLWRALPSLHGHRLAFTILAVGFPAAQSLFVAGQTSMFALLWLTLALVSFRRGQTVLAGLALGTLAYKPPLVMLVPFVLLVSRQYRALAAAAVSAAAQFAIAAAYFGASAVLRFMENLAEVAAHQKLLEANPHLMHSLRSFFLLLLPSRSVAEICYGVAALTVAAVTIRTWMTPTSLPIRYAVFLLATVLVSPHLYVYDLVLLGPAFALVASVAIGHTGQLPLWMLLYGSYMLSTFQNIPLATNVQVTVIALTGLLIVTSQFRTPASPHELSPPQDRS